MELWNSKYIPTIFSSVSYHICKPDTWNIAKILQPDMDSGGAEEDNWRNAAFWRRPLLSPFGAVQCMNRECRPDCLIIFIKLVLFCSTLFLEPFPICSLCKMQRRPDVRGSDNVNEWSKSTWNLSDFQHACSLLTLVSDHKLGCHLINLHFM